MGANCGGGCVTGGATPRIYTIAAPAATTAAIRPAMTIFSDLLPNTTLA
jgi:hypothetical protein